MGGWHGPPGNVKPTSNHPKGRGTKPLPARGPAASGKAPSPQVPSPALPLEGCEHVPTGRGPSRGRGREPHHQLLVKQMNSFGTALATQREEEALNSWPIWPC